MSSIARPPDPCLVAVVLIVRSRAGPRFVFHYPPSPDASSAQGPSSSSTSRRGKNASGAARGSDSVPSSDADPASSSDEEDHHHQATANPPHDKGTGGAAPSPQLSAVGGSLLTQRKTTGGSAGGGGSGSGATSTPGPETAPGTPALGGIDTGSNSGSASRERRTESSHGQQASGGGATGTKLPSQPPWDTFLSLKTDVWEKLLCPAPAWHKRRFEVGVNDLAFVGWPVFAKRNGTWRRRTKKRRNEKKKGKAVDEKQRDESIEEDGEKEADEDENGGAPEQGALSDGGGVPRIEEEEDQSKEQMGMFNVVFVLNPSMLEYHVRVKEKYDNVIKKFGKGLKSEQSRAGYVWSEAQKILQLKEKAREDGLSVSALYSELLSKSSLAQAIATVYKSISSSKIASVTLTPQTTMSLQIPPLTSTSSLPSATELSYPGLWLTTADSLSATDEALGMAPSGPSKVLAKHFALLLLSDEATILKDIESSMGSLGSPLAHYIRYSKSNKSFAQISAQSQIPLSDIQVLANHLIYWRRARAIPPLNQRDTYIVSPNADMSKLAQASAAYEAMFPTLPSLPKMLSALSGTPRPYSNFIPSRDHKRIYFDILAWLLRGGWVTQLRTFGWIKVDPDVKRAVAESMARGEDGKEDGRATGDDVDGDSPGVENHTPREAGEGDYDDDVPSSYDSEASGEITPIPGRPSHRRQPSKDKKHSGTPATASLIPQPQRASPLESRWLDEIFSRFPEPRPQRHDSFGQGQVMGAPGDGGHFAQAALDDSLQKYWGQLIKYFNGTDAMEKIPVREGLKKILVWRILNRIDASSASAPPGAKGSAVQGQGQGPNQNQNQASVDRKEKVLLTVRHW